MANRQTSFEERLARIENSRGGPPVPPPSSPSTGGQPPRRGSGRIIGAFFGVFFAAVAVFTILTLDEGALVASSVQAVEDEIAGKHTIATALNSDIATGIAFAPTLSALFVKHKLKDENLTPEQQRKMRNYIKKMDGKSMADILRENMRSTVVSQAHQAKGHAYADDVNARLNACRSTICLETVASMVSIEYDNRDR